MAKQLNHNNFDIASMYHAQTIYCICILASLTMYKLCLQTHCATYYLLDF